MARSRWGTRGLDNAVAVVVQRHDELNRDHLAALAAALLDDTDHDERNADDA
jgi:hypothetical protein